MRTKQVFLRTQIYWQKDELMLTNLSNNQTTRKYIEKSGIKYESETKHKAVNLNFSYNYYCIDDDRLECLCRIHKR